MNRAFCGHCGADWHDEHGREKPPCECRRQASRVVESSALERFAALLTLSRIVDRRTGKVMVEGISPEMAADLATGRSSFGVA